MGNLSCFFQEPVIMWMDDITVILIIITGGGGAWEVLSIICNVAVTLFHRPVTVA